MLVADGKGDYAFLSLKGPAFDLTDRGVAGRSVAAGLDAFVYTERGVYRTGETVHLTTLLRDAKGVAVTGVPMTLVIERPDGVEYRRTVVQDQGIGGRSLSFPMISSAPTGTYRVRAYTDPKGPPVGSTSFLVEDYVPDRMEFDLASPTGKLSKETPAEVTLDGRFLYGAPASNLDLEGEMKVKAADGPARALPATSSASMTTRRTQHRAGRRSRTCPQTDDDGKAKFTVTLDKLPNTSRPLEAQITVRLVESGGRAVERNLTLPIVPSATMIGVKPLFAGKSLGEGENAGFDVIVVAPDGKQLAGSGLRYELLKIERRYQYYRRDGRWEYEPVKSTRRMADGRIDVAADRPGRISLPVTWGRYRLDVASDDRSIPPTSVTFDAGFYSDASADTPDLLEIALDKSEYASGDTMHGRRDGAHRRQGHDQRGRRPAAAPRRPPTCRPAPRRSRSTSAATGARAPMWWRRCAVRSTRRQAACRAAPSACNGSRSTSAARTLALQMPLPSLMRPNGTLARAAPAQRARRRRGGQDRGRRGRCRHPQPDQLQAAVAGRLLPRPAPPHGGDPRPLWPTARRHAGHARRDPHRRRWLAGRARRARRRPSRRSRSIPASSMSRSDGTAEVQFDIPAFAGTVRVMAVAWSKDKVGHASGDVTVRDPVVLTATLPRFLLTGDRGTIRLDLDNVEGPAGEYAISVQTDGPLAVGPGGAEDPPRRQAALRRQPADQRDRGRHRQCGDPRQRPERLRDAAQLHARRQARDAGDHAPHRAADRAGARASRISSDLFADLVPGTGGVQLSVGPSTALDVAALLKALDRYPFGCTEQTTSRALPLLYVNELASEAHLSLDAAIDQRIRDAIERAARAPGLERLVRPVGTGRRRHLARRLCDRLPHPGARAQLRGAGRRVQAGARPPAQSRRPERSGQVGQQRADLRVLRARPQRHARRSATCATSPTPSSPS